MELLINALVIAILLLSALFWYRSATLDDSKSSDYGLIGAGNESTHNKNIPKFDEYNFYIFFCVTLFLLKNYKKLDMFCINKETYDCLIKTLNASAALYAFIATCIQALLYAQKNFPSFPVMETYCILPLAFLLALAIIAVYQKIAKKKH